MDKLKNMLKKIKKEDVWGTVLIIFLILNFICFFWDFKVTYKVALNYVSSIICAFSLGLWIESY